MRILPIRWIKLVRISPPQVDQAGENTWIMLVGNDTAAFLRRSYTEPNMTVVSIDTSLLRRAIDLYADRDDKDRG